MRRCATGPSLGGPGVPEPRTEDLPLWEGKPQPGGYRDRASHSISLPPSVGLGSIHLSEVRCRGYERTLGECPSLEGSQNGCRHENDAAVRCNVPNMGFRNQVSSGLGMASAWGLGKPRTLHGARGEGFMRGSSSLCPSAFPWSQPGNRHLSLNPAPAWPIAPQGNGDA